MRTKSYRQPQRPPQHAEEKSVATVKRKHIYLEHTNKRINAQTSETETNNFEALCRCSAASSSSSRARTHSKRRKRSNSSGSRGSRQWVFSPRDCSNYKDKLVIVSYNILGVENAARHPDLYFDVPPKFLDWERRKYRIYKEVNRYNAGILCFQEVDRFKDLDDLFHKDGFKGVYKARTGDACDGCALFWKDNIFTLLHEENIEFQNYGLRNNVAQLCVLKMNQHQLESDSQRKSSKITPMRNRSLLVGNIHVLFNPNRGDIKLGQVRLFIEKAYKLSQEWGNIPVILVGDFNSIPQSALYQFLASSELNVQLHDRRKISGQLDYSSQIREIGSQNMNIARFHAWMPVSSHLRYTWSDEELVLATGNCDVSHLRHKLKLSSAYAGIHGSSRTRDSYGEPLATSYHSKFMGTVDYIWHTRELVPVRVLETLPIDILRRNAGLPSERCGSDHLSLVCELAFSDDDHKAKLTGYLRKSSGFMPFDIYGNQVDAFANLPDFQRSASQF